MNKKLFTSFNVGLDYGEMANVSSDYVGRVVSNTFFFTFSAT